MLDHIMSRDFKSELLKIDSVIDKLANVANSDGKITKEEQELLDGIMTELSDYRLLVLDALEDGEIDEKEKLQMENALDKIVDNASKLALEDGDLSDDEQKLIEQLISFADQ